MSDNCPQCESPIKGLRELVQDDDCREWVPCPHPWHDSPASQCPQCGSYNPPFKRWIETGGDMIPCDHPWHDSPASPATFEHPVGTVDNPWKPDNQMQTKAAPPVNHAEMRSMEQQNKQFGEVCRIAAHVPVPEGDESCCGYFGRNQWHKAQGNPPTGVGDCRKLVWLRDKDGMEWCGIRAYNHSEMRWWINAVNGGREESAVVLAWQDLPIYREPIE